MNGSRKIKASSKLSIRGKHNSTKMYRMIPWESTLERDFIKLLDFDPTVVYFEFQPLRIDYLYKGKQKKYYPDFLVQKSNSKRYIYEVKAFEQTKEEINKIKFQVGKMYSRNKGMDYIVITEKDIRKGFLIENIDLLTEVRYETTSKRVMTEIVNKLDDLEGRTTKANLRGNLSHISKREFDCNLYYLIYTHQIKTDLISVLLNEHSIILGCDC
ncbi:TnsA endonuclease N-terminal domain-containing protein (plasmid) [Metabacillus halosaccharovorans]|uniref:TnsA endonuclease N-terminal domain-containing protein n=1 Tax=Bacillaceae TaxID=186817 RepID=UPI00158DCAF1|nr:MULTISPECIES: TnsA endonuclease N-terminal domain-containing protein [Bacillaceae]MCM3443549.1 TnsA endonuclease N-terminal domain-containing protein [Metabacillus halosaccharovorans]